MGLKALELTHDPLPELLADVISQSGQGRTAVAAIIGYPSARRSGLNYWAISASVPGVCRGMFKLLFVDRIDFIAVGLAAGV